MKARLRRKVPEPEKVPPLAVRLDAMQNGYERDLGQQLAAVRMALSRGEDLEVCRNWLLSLGWGRDRVESYIASFQRMPQLLRDAEDGPDEEPWDTSTNW
jgi:hypothetical protein